MRSKLILLAVAAGATGLSLAIGHEVLAKYEEPDYKVLEKENDFEIRQYPAVIAAEVQVKGAGESAANEAFKILAGYIFGKNVSKQKIAMTVPVTEEFTSEKIAMTVPVISAEYGGTMTMRFFMPAGYSLETLPESIDKRISFLTLPAARFAVARFSGFSSDKNMNRHAECLRAYVNSKGLKVRGEPIRAFYNPPWTLPFMRRNEVWIPIAVD